MKFLIDMNLSPAWVPVLTNAGWTAAHRSTVGDPRATDSTLMAWAAANGQNPARATTGAEISVCDARLAA